MTNIKRLEALEAQPAARPDEWLRVATPCDPDRYVMHTMDGAQHVLTAAELHAVGTRAAPVVILDK